MIKDFVHSAYIVCGQPHILLAHDKSPGWQALYDGYAKAREEIKNSDAEMILYLSTQWLSVLGWMFQANPEPTWRHVDPNWHEFGTIDYKFKVDADFAPIHAEEVKKTGRHVSLVNYYGFPVDTGTIVAQKLLNPDSRLPASMIACNMYAEKLECMRTGRAGAAALARYGKKTVVVLVSNLSNRNHIKDIDPAKDFISSNKDDEWNQKMLELLSEGRFQDTAECAREAAREANGDLGYRGLWWLYGLLGESNNFKGKVFAYAPVWGAGGIVAGLYPTKPVPVPYDVEPEQAAKGKDAAAVETKKAPDPVGPYPHARREGDMIFVSGIGPRKPGTNEIPGAVFDKDGNEVSHDIDVQARSCLDNIKIVLEEAGSSLDDVVDVQVFLTDMKNDFQRFNKVYAEYLGTVRPTRTTVGVLCLPTPIAVELKVIAKLKHAGAAAPVAAGAPDIAKPVGKLGDKSTDVEDDWI